MSQSFLGLRPCKDFLFATDHLATRINTKAIPRIIFRIRPG